MRKLIIILIACLTFLAKSAYPQTDTLRKAISLESLSADNLKFYQDSNRLKVISTGRLSKNLDDLPFTVYVVSHEEILKNQYTTLIDVLNSLPGIRTSQPGSGELGESFQIWGLTGNLYSKILINGLPIKPSVVSGMPIGSQLPIRQAEKIEVVFGNSSAVYGADAVSGVINIITKKAEKGTFVRGDVGLGEGGYNYVNFFVGGKAGRNNNILQYSFYGSKSELARMNIEYEGEEVYNPLNYYQSTGKTFNIGGNEYEALDITENLLVSNGVDPEDFIDEYYGEQYEGTLTRPEMQDMGSSSYMLGMQMNFRGISFTYDNMYRRTHSSLGLSPVFYKFNNPQNYWGDIIQRTTLSYSKDFRKFSSSSQVSYLNYNMDNNSSQGITFWENSDKVYRYSASNDLMFEQVFSASPFKNLEWVAGFSYNQSGNLPLTNYLTSPFRKFQYSPFSEKVETSDPILGSFGLNPIRYNNTSGFLHSYYILGRFRFLGGLRYDINTLYGNTTSPQLSVLFRKNAKTSFRFSSGTSYKAPPSSIAYQSLAYPITANSINYQVVPNPNLKPETFVTMELGLKTTIFKRLLLDQTFFYYQIKDHIVPQTVPVNNFHLLYPANDSVRTWVNNDQSVSNIIGSQTTLKINDLIRSIHFNAELSLTLQERQDKLPDVKEIVAEYLTLSPKHMGKLKISMDPIENMHLYIESHWMSKWLRVLIPFESLYEDLFKNTDGYYAMNVMTSYQLSDQLNVFVRVTNLFDEKYGGVNATFIDENLIYNPQLRRNIRFGLSFNLN
jgi:outer membrane cobalamin receptor